MHAQRFVFDTANRIQVAADVTAVPATPTATGDGTDISTLKHEGSKPRFCALDFEKGSGASSIVLTGPVDVWVLRGGALPWYNLGPVLNGDDIALDDGQGESAIMQFVADFTRMLIVPVGITAVHGFDCYLTPLELRG